MYNRKLQILMYRLYLVLLPSSGSDLDPKDFGNVVEQQVCLLFLIKISWLT